MKLGTGTIITGVAMLIFYLRLMQIRGRKLRLARQAGRPGQTKGGKRVQRRANKLTQSTLRLKKSPSRSPVGGWLP
jgi:hypothetical protein